MYTKIGTKEDLSAQVCFRVFTKIPVNAILYKLTETFFERNGIYGSACEAGASTTQFL